MLNQRFFIAAVLSAFMSPAWSASTLVAVAANFTKPMTDIAAEFQKATGHEAKLSFGSSGKFVAQIENGAPFEVFLAADQDSVVKLQSSGLAVTDSRFTYALGKLVLWSATPAYADDQGSILQTGGFKHIALADPKLAPYGAAAIEVLKNLGVLETVRPLLVQGENISQTHQFISTGNAELGFVALSQVIENGTIVSGSGWIVPGELYSPIRQDAVLLAKGEDNPAATALLQFLKGPQARAIIQKYGYSLPEQP
ncbi:MAG: molybdate ABC transporter substrate-binding protein [Methylomonas sp.]|nr:molybdate ABC transporter substrate-binding protein [Methylomonas sp.]PPD20281.1 MAG: molybdate ABC transporter substrate-binding protein [Methylomonas sp.]PPD25460.1 MAG: molybdate ABC transporter substrate-binding protein [Methylomonas sp.]PPD36162.1 MAG: molybdate ABC transporter substrate-binding protein [Methylomonas sp.]PPD41174.1 MAG: molybdate ABC transporter substrate-binding protein [Methylomonas sp.]